MDGQNKKRKFVRDRDDRDGQERRPEAEQDDPLKDATTLYVGNLWATPDAQVVDQIADPKSRSFYTTEEQIQELFSK